MWQDMGLYWAARGPVQVPPPTTKRIEYATISYPAGSQRLAVAVWDDDMRREVNAQELAWHRAQGAEVTHDA
jgi:hypothetical protein